MNVSLPLPSPHRDFSHHQPCPKVVPSRARTHATALEARVHPGPIGLSKTDPKSLALESYAQRKFVYSPPIAASHNPHGTIQHHAITPAYATKARTLAEKQLVYAGYRLAKLLNGIYGSP